jgi:hypothetical protein
MRTIQAAISRSAAFGSAASSKSRACNGSPTTKRRSF